jgi:hypothetical protein
MLLLQMAVVVVERALPTEVLEVQVAVAVEILELAVQGLLGKEIMAAMLLLLEEVVAVVLLQQGQQTQQIEVEMVVLERHLLSLVHL